MIYSSERFCTVLQTRTILVYSFSKFEEQNVWELMQFHPNWNVMEPKQKKRQDRGSA